MASVLNALRRTSDSHPFSLPTPRSLRRWTLTREGSKAADTMTFQKFYSSLHIFRKTDPSPPPPRHLRQSVCVARYVWCAPAAASSSPRPGTGKWTSTITADGTDRLQRFLNVFRILATLFNAFRILSSGVGFFYAVFRVNYIVCLIYSFVFFNILS